MVEEAPEEVIQPEIQCANTRISEKFKNTASDDIRIAYEECWKYENEKIGNTEFMNKQVRGVLKKAVDEQKVFVKDFFPSRYYVIDFTKAMLIIKHDRFDKENDPNNKTLAFRDIIDCYLPTEKNEEKMQ